MNTKHDPYGQERRATMIEFNLDYIRFNYQQWKQQNRDTDPVVFVLDLDDPHGKQLHLRVNYLDEAAGKEDQADIISKCRIIKAIPTGYGVLDRQDALKLLRRFQQFLHKTDSRNPKVSEMVEMLVTPAPSGFFYCVALSRGKVCALIPVDDGGIDPKPPVDGMGRRAAVKWPIR